MATKDKNIKATPEELERWKAAADLRGLPLNTWLRRSLNERAQLEQALERQRQRDESAGRPDKTQ